MIQSSALSACLFFLLILAPISRPALLLPTMIHRHPLGSWLGSGCKRGRTAFLPPSSGVAHLLDMARSSTVPPRSLCSLDGRKRTAAEQQYGQRCMAINSLATGRKACARSQGCTSARGRGGLLLGMVTGDSGDGDDKDDAMDQNAMDVLREVTFDEATIVGKLMRTLTPQLFVPTADREDRQNPAEEAQAPSRGPGADSASAAPGQLEGAPAGEGDRAKTPRACCQPSQPTLLTDPPNQPS